MYTHSLWGTWARRDHLWTSKKFWCGCKRCEDPTEFGTNFSTVIRNGKFLNPSNPLDQKAPWISEDGKEEIEAEVIQDDMTKIGAELALLQISKLKLPCKILLPSFRIVPSRVVCTSNLFHKLQQKMEQYLIQIVIMLGQALLLYEVKICDNI